jgi:membrane protein YqaA with SNARE-associated domain
LLAAVYTVKRRGEASLLLVWLAPLASLTVAAGWLMTNGADAQTKPLTAIFVADSFRA